MKIETTQLQKPATYAKKLKRDRTRVYQMIHEGKLETVEIDGVIFVKVTDNG